MTDTPLLLAYLCWTLGALILSWCAPTRWQPIGIATCGIALLAHLAPLSLLFLATSTLVTFAVVQWYPTGRPALLASITILAGGYLSCMLSAQQTGEGIATTLILPLGMAYYTLRLIHYMFESFKGTLREHSFSEYLCYQFLPATLPVGPIHRFDEFTRDLRRRRWDASLFVSGNRRVIYGLAKIIIIGNYLLDIKLEGQFQAWAHQPGVIGVYFSAIIFWLRLYIMFSGFSDLAVGLSAMMGFRIRENFNWPFLSRNISEFWQRWHISLSTWCRDYVYTPVLASGRSHSLAVISSMVVLGLWHEPSLRYILWGAYHGLGITLYRAFSARASNAIDTLPAPLKIIWQCAAILITLHFVLFSFPVTQSIEHWLIGK